MAKLNPSTKEMDIAHLKLLGVTSSSEAQTIEKRLLKINGVKKVSINLVEIKARVEFDPNEVIIEILIETVEDLGFGALDSKF